MKYVALKTPQSVKSAAVAKQIKSLIEQGYKTSEIAWKMEFTTTDAVVKEVSEAFRKLKNQLALAHRGLGAKKKAKTDPRIQKMVDNWKQDGRAFSKVEYTKKDGAFFKAIGIDPDTVGVTSQYGLDVVYYNTDWYSSDTQALRKKRDVGLGAKKKAKTATLLVVSQSKPMYSQLKKITGDGTWAFKELMKGEVYVHTPTGKMFIVMSLSEYENLNAPYLKRHLDYFKKEYSLTRVYLPKK